MIRPMPWMLIAAAVALPIAALAAVVCPATLPGVRANEVPAGWKAFPPASVRLAGGGLLRGDPSREVYLRGDSEKTRSGSISVSDFAPGEEKWLWCGYGGTSALQIAKRLPDSATVCTVTYKATQRDGITAIDATCR